MKEGRTSRRAKPCIRGKGGGFEKGEKNGEAGGGARHQKGGLKKAGNTKNGAKQSRAVQDGPASKWPPREGVVHTVRGKQNQGGRVLAKKTGSYNPGGRPAFQSSLEKKKKGHYRARDDEDAVRITKRPQGQRGGGGKTASRKP